MTNTVSTPADIYEAVRKLMFAYGDDAEPDETCHRFVVDILRIQLIDTLNRARKCAKMRGSKKIEGIDMLFILRKSPLHLNRIYQMAKSTDLLKRFSEDDASECDILAEIPHGSNFNFCGKEAQFVYDTIGVFDVTGELQRYLKCETKVDEEKRERLKRLAERTALMDENEYKRYTEARTYNFCAGYATKKTKIARFLKWLDNPEIAQNALIVLNYIGSEMICCLVEGALLSKKAEEKNYPRDITTSKILQLRHYEESLRKNQAFSIGGNLLIGSFQY